MPLKVISLRVPRESENTPEQTAQLLASLARATKARDLLSRLSGIEPVSLSLEVTLTNGQIVFAIVCPAHLATFVQSQMLATYQDVVMTEIKDYLFDWSPATPGTNLYLSVIRQAYAPYFPLRDYSDYKEVDPMLPFWASSPRPNPMTGS